MANQVAQEKSKSSIDKNGERHWYAVHTYSGYEDAVARYLKQRIDSLEMRTRFLTLLFRKKRRLK